MENFDYLARKHDKALGLFAKVIRKLHALEEQINSLMTRSSESIAEANHQIEEENQALQILKERLNQAQKSRNAVETLTGVQSVSRG